MNLELQVFCLISTLQMLCAALFKKLFNVSSICQNEAEDSGNDIIICPRELWRASNSINIKIQ